MSLTISTQEEDKSQCKDYRFTKRFENFVREYSADFSVESINALEKQIKADKDEDKKTTEKKYKDKLNKIRSSSYSNTLLTYCILANIRQNNKYMTETAVKDTVRGLAAKHEGCRNPAKYSKLFRMIPDDEVDSVINWLFQMDIIKNHYVNGYYQDYYTLEIKDDTLANVILADCQQMINISEKIGNEPVSDISLLGLVQSENEFEKIGVKAYLEIFEHPYVFCVMEDNIYRLFRAAPEPVKYFVKIGAEVEDGMKKKMCSLILKNALK